MNSMRKKKLSAPLNDYLSSPQDINSTNLPPSTSMKAQRSTFTIRPSSRENQNLKLDLALPATAQKASNEKFQKKASAPALVTPSSLNHPKMLERDKYSQRMRIEDSRKRIQDLFQEIIYDSQYKQKISKGSFEGSVGGGSRGFTDRKQSFEGSRRSFLQAGQNAQYNQADPKLDDFQSQTSRGWYTENPNAAKHKIDISFKKNFDEMLLLKERKVGLTKKDGSLLSKNSERGPVLIEEDSTVKNLDINIPNTGLLPTDQLLRDLSKLDLDSTNWLGEEGVKNLVKAVKTGSEIFKLSSPGGTDIKNIRGNQANIVWKSIQELYDVVETYFGKVTKKYISEDYHEAHVSLQQMLLREMRGLSTKLQQFLDEKLKLYLHDLESLKETQTNAVLESNSDYRRIIKETNEWFRISAEKYGVPTDCKYLLPRENPQSQVLDYEIDKVKSYLYVKNQGDMIASMTKLEKVLDELLTSFISKAHQAESLKKKEDYLEGVIYQYKDGVFKRIQAMEEEYAKVVYERPPDRFIVFSQVEEEFKTLKENYTQELNELKTENAELQKTNQNLNQEIKVLREKQTIKVLTNDVKIQACLDVEDKTLASSMEEVKCYYENINYFIAGGSLRTIDWAHLLINDIYASKLYADFEDIKYKRALTPLKNYVLQYFLKQFGCRRASLALLRDFYFTLSQFFQQSLKIENFIALSESNSIKTKLNVDMKEFLRRNRVQFKIYSLASTCSFYLDVAYMYRRLNQRLVTIAPTNIPALTNIYGPDSSYFMPNNDQNSNFLVNAATAESFCKTILKKYGFEADLINLCMSKFDKVIKTDLALRVVHNRATRLDENDKNRFISFESIAEFLLDQYVTNYRDHITSFATNLRMVGISKYDSRKCLENIVFALENSKFFNGGADSRYPEIVFEKYLSISDNLYMDIDSLICNFLKELDDKRLHLTTKLDYEEAFKGVRFRHETSNQALSDILKLVESKELSTRHILMAPLESIAKPNSQLKQSSKSISPFLAPNSPNQQGAVGSASNLPQPQNLNSTASLNQSTGNHNQADQHQLQQTVQAARKYIKILLSDPFTHFLAISNTFTLLEPEFEKIINKTGDSNQINLLRETKKLMYRDEFGVIEAKNDIYPSIDVEILYAKVENLDKKFRSLLAVFFLEV